MTKGRMGKSESKSKRYCIEQFITRCCTVLTD